MKNLLLTATALLGFATATLAQVPNYVPTNGLVGWWPFNGNANDESGNGNNGTVNGATLTEDRFGNVNSAYAFNGINFSHISIPSDSTLDLINDFTISCWFYSNSMYNQQGTVRSILMKSGDGVGMSNGFAHGLWGGVNGTNNQVGIINFQAQPFNNSLTYPDGNSGFVSINNWYNYLLTYTKADSTLKYFLNDLLVDVKILNFNIGYNNNDLWIGSQNSIYSTIKTFQGTLDDIGIWNRALTQEEITNLYNGNICFETITVTDTLLINMGIVGYNPISYSNTIKIFPNPSNDHITIDYGDFASLSGYQLRIDNSLGQQMFQTAINQQSSYISLSSWTGNGLYFVHIIDPQGNTIDIRKIVLQ
jgi:hypothetical protein